MLYLLSQYPQVEQKLLQELDSMQLLATRERSHPRLVTPADLGRLIYLQAIIKVFFCHPSQARLHFPLFPCPAIAL